MKHVLWLFLAISIIAGPICAAVATPNIKASSAILTDATTGQVLFEKNADEHRPMASTTKIMTAILTIENCKMDDTITASKNVSQTQFTSMHLLPGEQISVRDALTAMLLRSANDCAVALAEHIGGSVDGFAQMMNDKAKELGAKNTHFVTPNGLYAPGHYTTARDLALIARYALRLPIFNEIVATRCKRIERSMNQQDVFVTNKSKFLRNYQGADGVKSGYIKQAGHCYVGSATRGGWRLVSVVLNSPDTQAETTMQMDYGFKNYQRIVLGVPEQPVTKMAVIGGVEKLDVVLDKKLTVAVKVGQAASAKTEIHLNQIQAPVKKGDKVGTMVACVGNKPVASVDLVAASDINPSMASTTWPWVRSFGLLAMISIGVTRGRAFAKSTGSSRSRFSKEV